MQTLIIGAGLAGLTVARNLRQTGRNVVVVDKAATPGGRIATRCGEHGEFDHGAQYLTNRTPEFTALLNPLVQAGDLVAWKPVGKDSARPWWVGKPGMAAFGESLARDLPCQYRTRVTAIEKSGAGYAVRAETADGETMFEAEQLVTAIPAAQAAELLKPLDPAFAQLDQVDMAPCLAAMMAFDHTLPDMPDMLRGRDDDLVGFFVHNGSKPGRKAETYVVHATPYWSRRHFDDDEDAIVDAMLDELRVISGLGTDLPAPTHTEIKRWRYALVDRPLGSPFLANADNTAFACGDWCMAARIEAAHQSGLALARHIISG